MADTMRAKQKINGHAVICAMMRAIEPSFRQHLLKKLEPVAPDLVALVEKTSFLYLDIARLDDKGIQTLLRDMTQKEWLIAWKLTPSKLRKLLLRNMSNSQQTEFLEEFSLLPKMKRSLVMATQMRIAGHAHQLLCLGKIRFRNRTVTAAIATSQAS